MSKNTFKVGDKVKLVALSGHTDSIGFKIGDKARVIEVGLADDELGVRIENAEHACWVNHEDIKLRGKEKKPLKVGDKVIVKVQPNSNFFPVGTEGIVAGIDKSAPEYKVEALGDYWFYTREQLKRVKEEKPAAHVAPTAAPTPKRDIKAELEAAWPWPEGTPVSFSKDGRYSRLAGMPSCTLGSDGSSLPPVLDAYGEFVNYVDASCVTLRTEYETWGETSSSRIVSDLTEEQRTGPMRNGIFPGTVDIQHSEDGKEAPRYWVYSEGDYRDNGDGTGTVLTLEEIFLNNLKK